MAPAVLEIEGLSVALPKGADRRFAVEAVSIGVRAGEILCLVGESGSGKSVTAMTLMGLTDGPNTSVEGSVRLEGQELVVMREDDIMAVVG